jgi:hypothetical protein
MGFAPRSSEVPAYAFSVPDLGGNNGRSMAMLNSARGMAACFWQVLAGDGRFSTEFREFLHRDKPGETVLSTNTRDHQ